MTVKNEIIVLPYGIKRPLTIPVNEAFTIKMELTPEMAKEWLKKNKLNRPLNRRNVAFLIHEIKNDRWQYNGESIQFDKNGNLINGQHRCEAVVGSQKSIITNVTIGLDNEVFHTIDTGKTRSAQDVLAIAGIKNYSTAAAAARFIIDFQRGRYTRLGKTTAKDQLVDNGEILEFVETTPDFQEVCEFAEHLYHTSGRFVPKKLVGGLYFFFRQKDKFAAKDFFEKLCLGINIEKGSPLFLLRRKLMQDRQDRFNKMSHIYKVAIIVRAWNAVRGNEDIKYLQYSKNQKFPEII